MIHTKNIVLIGFMGSGKTVVAKRIAGALEMRLLNTDDLIEKKEGAAINEIFSKKGESYFREIEREVIKGLSAKQGIVIDAGGGVVISEDNVKNLKKNGIIFCLNTTPEEILKRTKKHRHRPLLNVENPMAKIKDLLEERKEYYERADYQVVTSGKNAAEVAEEIIAIYNKRLADSV